MDGEWQLPPSKSMNEHCFSKITLSSSRVENCCQQQTNLQGKITKVWSGDTWSLESEIQNFHQTTDGRKKDLENVEHDLQTIKSKIEATGACHRKLDTQLERVTTQLSTEKKIFAKRERDVHDICDLLAIRFKKEVDSSQLNDIKASISQQDQAVKAMALDHDEIDQQLQDQIDSIREAKTKIETELTATRNLFEQKTEEQKRVDNELMKIGELNNSLATIMANIEQLNKKLEKNNIAELRQSSTVKKENIERLQPQLDKLDEDIGILSSLSEITGKLELNGKNLLAKEAEFQRLKLKNADHMKTLFDAKPVESNFKQHVQNVYGILNQEINSLQKDMEKKQALATECETKRVALKDQLSCKECELAKAEEEINDICKGNCYEDLLENAKEEAAKLTLEVAASENLKVINELYISKIQETPCCPLCANPMAAHGVDQLKQKLADEIRDLPDKLRRVRWNLEIEQKNCDKLMAVGAQIEKAAKLKETIPQLKTSLRTVEEGVSNASIAVKNYELQLTEAKQKQQMVNLMLGDMSLMDEIMRNTLELKHEVEDLQQKLPSTRPTKSIEEVKAARLSVAKELRAERESRDTLERQIEAFQDDLNKTRDQVNQLNESKIQLQEQRQGFDQLNKRKAEILDEVKRVRAEVMEVEARLPAVTAHIEQQVEKKRRTKDTNRQELVALTNKVVEIKKNFLDIERYTTELQRFGELNLTEKLGLIKSDMDQCQAELTALVADNDRHTANRDTLNKQIANQVTIERNLTDNLELRKLQAEENKLRNDLDELQREIDVINMDRMLHEKEEINRKCIELHGKVNTTQGQINQIQETVTAIERELAEPKLKNAQANYMAVFYKVFVTGKIGQDLKKYQKVLENALTDFHQKKMLEINELLKLYWREIYQ
jgi:DNA repair protein RAD50